MTTSDLAGRTGRPFRMPVEPGKCREFHRATRPISWTKDHPHPICSPVTFLASARFWLAPEDSAWHGIDRDYRRVLHGEQEFTFSAGPPAIGSELTGAERIDRVYEKPGGRGTMEFTETVTDFVPLGGNDVVASLRATSVLLEQSSPGTVPMAVVATWSAPEDHELVLALTDEPLTVTDFVRYQGASGDFNPIHHDQAFAEAGGYPGPFAVGMLTAGVVGTLLSTLDDTALLIRLVCRWKAQAWPGDALTYRIYEAPARAARRFVIDVALPSGQTHLQAQAYFGGLR